MCFRNLVWLMLTFLAVLPSFHKMFKTIDQYKRTHIDKEPIRNRTKDVQPMPSARKHRCNSDCHWPITERWKMQESQFNGCAFDWFPLCSKLILTACDWTNTNQRETAIKS